MTLTGGAFALLVGLLLAAAFASTVYFWPRLAARRPLVVAGRAGLLLTTNVLVLAFAATVMNDTFLFYADWTDLFGASHVVTHAAIGHAGGSVAGAVGGSADPTSAVRGPLPPLPATSGGGRVIRFEVTGATSGLTAPVLVVLPVGYRQDGTGTGYPVIEAMHGYPGEPEQWLDSIPVEPALDAAVHAHRIRPAVVVIPSLEIPAGRDTECVDGGGQLPAVEQWLTVDVPRWVDQTFRVQTGRRSWSTLGFSAGGWCAAMATMLHPDQYASAVVLGGYFRPAFSRSWVPFYAKSARYRGYDLVDLARHAPPPVAIWLETSHSDMLSYTSSAELAAAARAPLSVQAVVLSHAGHRLALWQSLLPQALDWLGANVPGFRPSAATGSRP